MIFYHASFSFLFVFLFSTSVKEFVFEFFDSFYTESRFNVLYRVGVDLVLYTFLRETQTTVNCTNLDRVSYSKHHITSKQTPKNKNTKKFPILNAFMHKNYHHAQLCF